MGLSLKGLFKKKPGGTLFGNGLKALAKLGSTFGLPGAGLVSSLLPEAPPFVLNVARNAVAEAAAGPVLNFGEVKQFASDVKQQLIDAGASPADASKIGAVAFTAASLPPAQAVQTLGAAQTQVNNLNANGAAAFSAGDLKTILNGAVDGARDGATDAYLNNTATGKEQKKGAINAEGAKVMPWVIGGCVAVIAWLAARGRN